MGCPFGMDLNASTGSGWAGTTRERPPLPSLTGMAGDAAAKFRSLLPASTLPPAAAQRATALGQTARAGRHGGHPPPHLVQHPVAGKLAGGHGVHRPPRFYNGRVHRRSLPFDRRSGPNVVLAGPHNSGPGRDNGSRQLLGHRRSMGSSYPYGLSNPSR